MVRQATPNDLPGIVDIHQKAFSHFFLTQLGSDFLRNYYALVLDYRAGIMLVSEGPGALEGFACGFVDPAEFYRLMWRSRRTFVLPVLSALAPSPIARRQGPDPACTGFKPGVRVAGGSCELSSIAVAPEASW